MTPTIGDTLDVNKTTPGDDGEEHFICPGDGNFPKSVAVSLEQSTNPLCCALSPDDDSVLGVGRADGSVEICCWGRALVPKDATSKEVEKVASVSCQAPVICIGLAPVRSNNLPMSLLATGCMDGRVHLVGYSISFGGVVDAWKVQALTSEENNADGGDTTNGNDGGCLKHTKHVKSLAWSKLDNNLVLATSDANGNVTVYRVGPAPITQDGQQCTKTVIIQKIVQRNLKGAIEALCFVKGGTELCLYERDTSYLSYLKLDGTDDVARHSLNGAIVGKFDEHVSFAVMHLALSPCGKYVCAATDASRNIILRVGTSHIVKDLYGHRNDAFSQPRIAWSRDGKYVFGNSQEDGIVVWDISGANIVLRLDKKKGGHEGTVRDIFSSRAGDTLVSVSYDRTAKVWLNDV